MSFRGRGFATGIALAATLAAGGLTNKAVFGGPFTAGNLAVLRAEESDSNTPASIVELDPNTAAQSPSNVIAIPGTGATGLRFSGSATSTGYLSHTDDRSLLTFNGTNSTNTSSNANTLNPRSVGTLDASGAYVLQTTYTGGSGNQTRSSSSLNNTTWFIGDQGGVYSNGTISASPAGNFRGVKAFGGAVYTMTTTLTSTPVLTISAPTGGTVTSLPGLANNADGTAQDFYLIQSGTNGSAYDVLYVLNAGAAIDDIISKYSLVSGSWIANGSYTTSFEGFGLAARDSGDGAELFVTSGLGATTANSVWKVTDTTGFNTPINVVTGNNVNLFTAGAGTIVKGIDFAPIAVPEPSSIGLILMGAGLGFARSRRK